MDIRTDQRTVVVDPGHGGDTAIGSSTSNRARGPGGLEEKTVALDVARRLRDTLNGRGAQVVLTRGADSNLSLGSRALISRRLQASAFVSVHFGAHRDPGNQGTLTCVHERAGSSSRLLGRLVHTALLEVTGHRDLGVQAAPLAVLHPEAHSPDTACILIEPSVLTDPAEEQRLADPGYRQRLAGAVSRAVREWLLASQRRGGTIRAPVETIDASGVGKRAVVVGIDDYTRVGSGLDLRFARRDAESLGGVMVGAFGVPPENLHLLVDQQATAAAIEHEVRVAAEESAPGDVLCLAFAGRGTIDPAGQPRLVTADGERLSTERLRATLAGTPIRELTVFADTGLAADMSAPGSRSLKRAPEHEQPSQSLAADFAPDSAADSAPDTEDVTIRWFGACAPGAEAFEHEAVAHGLLTAALIERARAPGFEISGRGLMHLLRLDINEMLFRFGIVADQTPWQAPGPPDALVLAAPGTSPPEPLEPLRHLVPLVAQTTAMSCWAAAAAMIVGWRDRLVLDDATLAAGSNAWDSYQNGLRPTDVDTLASVWELTAEDPCFYSVRDLHRMVQKNGPLWVGEADPDLHVVVIAGMRGDGTPDGTEVEIADPWPVNRGERYTITFRELMDNFHTAAHIAGVHVQLLHTNGRADPGHPDGLPA